MENLRLPQPILKTRVRDKLIEQQGLEAGLHPIVARIIAARPLCEGLPILQALRPKLKMLTHPKEMSAIDKAAARVAVAIQKGECIGIETDHDCDGQTSHAVLYYNLVERFYHPKEKLRSYIGHRLQEGYGLSDSVATRILNDNPKPTLVITADNGSSDEPRIARLKAANIDVIVTDHHEIPKEGVPKSAYAVLNPTQNECHYNDPFIAGCMVAWLLMVATRQKLIESHYLPRDTPSLADSLDFVAVGTVADCVSLASSHNNRAVVAYGLQLINQGTRPCWQVIKDKVSPEVNSIDLAFKVGPLLNSDGRLACAFGSVGFLLAETVAEANEWLLLLQEHNKNRKKIQQEIVALGVKEAQKQALAHRLSLCIYLPEGHSGVQGIAASRVKELYGRPCAFFAPKLGQEGIITGSVRGIEHFHVRDALQMVAIRCAGKIISFGGHKGAGGVTLKLEDFPLFTEAFEEATRSQLNEEAVGPVIWTDGTLELESLSIEIIDTLNILEPFGREFEPPVFEMQAVIRTLEWVGDGTHARLLLEKGHQALRGIWFGARLSREAAFDLKEGDEIKFAYQAKKNHFKGKTSLDLQIIYATRI
jgi:single-stranded-DNA-specific exonuclease